MKKINKKDDRNVKFVLGFCKINLTKICNKLKLSRTSINGGTGKLEDYIKVREEIESELAKLYIKENENTSL